MLAAVELAMAGWPVLPLHWPRLDGATPSGRLADGSGAQCSCRVAGCASAGKHPFGRLAPHGVEDASSDVDVVRRWWETAPHANMGLATGGAVGAGGAGCGPAARRR